MPYKDPEKKREYDRKRREANREKIREYDRKWREANREKWREYMREYMREYFATHPRYRARNSLTSQEWHAMNRERTNEYSRNGYHRRKARREADMNELIAKHGV